MLVKCSFQFCSPKLRTKNSVCNDFGRYFCKGLDVDKTKCSAFTIHKSVVVEPNVTFLGNVQVDEGCRIGAGSTIGDDVQISKNSIIGKNVVLENVSVGINVTIKNGAKIGQDGFGWTPGTGGNSHQKKPQTKRVIIQDNVEIGANTCIDRGSWRDTIIGEGSKLDNQIQVGHNVHIGKHCLIAAQCGIAGSTTIGDYCMIGGQTGVAQHLKIGDNIQIAAKSGVTVNLPSGGMYGGMPAQILKQHRIEGVALRKLVRQLQEQRTGKQ